jgi:folate-binding protein YgfZ
LEDFIIADDVTVENAGAADGWTQITLAGPEAAGWILSNRVSLPAAGTWVTFSDGLLFAGRRGQTNVWDWLRPSSIDYPAITIEPGKLDRAALNRARIAAGVPAIPQEFGPQDLPQEAGLEDIAISFTKGCYLGQEIMARLHAMGHVRRRLVRLAGSGFAPEAGTGVNLEPSGRRIGEIRAAVDDGQGHWIGLAMLGLLKLTESEGLALEGENRRTVQVIE